VADEVSDDRRSGAAVSRAAWLVRAAQLHRKAWAGEGELGHAIHGTIVAAAVLTAASLHGSLGQIVVTVLVTLFVYWVAERYSALLASGVHGREPIRSRVVAVLRGGWPMIEAAYLPLIVLFAVTTFSENLQAGVISALSMSMLLLMALGLIAARRAGANGLTAVGWAVASGLLGLVMIALKLSLH
jgi:hypothetical protein